MGALEIRRDRSSAVLRKLVKGESNGRVARRILAIANALDGMSREAAAQSAGMDRQTLRDWVIRYNEQGIEGLHDRWGDGRPPTFTREEQAELMRIVLAGPDPETSGLSAYTLEDLAGICEKRFGKRISLVVRPLAEAARLLAAKDAAQPSAEGPGRSSGL